jgi:hypothetical protein
MTAGKSGRRRRFPNGKFESSAKGADSMRAWGNAPGSSGQKNLERQGTIHPLVYWTAINESRFQRYLSEIF